jgi:type VI secretion system secreted protein Hcp
MRTRYYVFAIVLTLLSFSTAYASLFLKMDGIPGESKAKDHVGWIEVTSLTLPATAPAAGSQREGRASLNETKGQSKPGSLSITKTVDKASPKLFQASAHGTHFATVLIEMERNSEEKGKYMEYKLSGVLISSCKVAPSSGGNKLPTEQITFSYQKLELSYTPARPSELIRSLEEPKK